jgi:predicted nuclease of predicted toxin-antitoxin system
MKFLLDVCCSSYSLRHFLIERGHDVRLVSDADPRASDETVLSMAHEEGSIVITEDKDFGELIAVQRRPHSGIIRFLELSVSEQVIAMQEVLNHYRGELESGAIMVVTRGRIRVRPNA